MDHDKRGDWENWLREYLEAPVDDIYELPIIQDLALDRLDDDDIELQIQRLMPAAAVKNNFCGKCRGQLADWPALGLQENQVTTGRALDTKEVEAASRMGCHFCQFMLSVLSTRCLLQFRIIEARLSFLGNGATASLGIKRKSSDKWECWINWPGRFATEPPERCDWKSIVEFQDEGTEVKDEDEDEVGQFLFLLAAWMKQCDERHKCAVQYKGESELPTRLISVDNGLRLVTTKSLSSGPVKYATLSYCWGTDDFIKLGQNNLESFLQDIPADGLPRTLRDAIEIVQKMGIPYIWIDALCIIQDEDDYSDWLKESVRMHQIYGGSYLNIAATCAKSVDEGFFHTGDRKRFAFLSRFDEHHRKGAYLFFVENAATNTIIDTHLSTRAWAFQERLLAPRTVYFGDRGMAYECRTDLKFGDLPLPFDSWMAVKVLPPDEPYPWHLIAMIYSEARLTHGSDFLPALSGVAKRQHEITKDTYLAGMWKEGLVRQLCWSRVDVLPRPEWRAPTWCWASGDGWMLFQINLPADEGKAHHSEYHAEVLDAWTRPADGVDPFGAVVGGELTLASASLIKANTVGIIEKSVVVGFSTSSVRVSIDMDCEIEEAHEPIYVLPMVSQTVEDEQGTFPKRPEIYGLALQRSGPRRGHFRRVGILQITSWMINSWNSSLEDQELEAACRELVRIMQEDGPFVAKDMCARTREAGDGKCFVFTIE
ncbi:hypothetical protein MGG_00820 [Pyricularia oryzae 70-15]|uniref:Heterokaryon incompatibility domain-containing protein n=1 Tax=Pyricularia oryzae (strain 70-15 / ATCC MYA-4617 / FGSC 8958) TaxID=242507 RepID=G4NE96_PYRO7|nr:uncharacterized protein MGG_00820 [Pyricularia oryzae 70-15]EHA48579.1 hypothetical protein MGG_00820 [Pyricularia oryzae 70-15]